MVAFIPNPDPSTRFQVEWWHGSFFEGNNATNGKVLGSFPTYQAALEFRDDMYPGADRDLMYPQVIYLDKGAMVRILDTTDEEGYCAEQ